MVARRKHDEKIVFTADSDAILTKGIIAILIRTFSNQTAKSILKLIRVL
jgi:cysteine desulfuration protein SufE